MVISTYQAASGAGQAAMDELELQTKEVLEGKEVTKNIFPFQVSSMPLSSLHWCLHWTKCVVSVSPLAAHGQHDLLHAAD